MSRRKPNLTSRRLLIAAVVFGLFVVFDIVLFGWLILDSLSQREIEEVLLETRQEAEPIARELAERAQQHDGDLFVVLSVAEETRTYIDDVLSQREIVRRIEIRDREGAVVYGPQWEHEDVPVETPNVPRVETGERSDGLALPDALGSNLDAVEVPIGDVGTLVIGVSEEEVQKRIGMLRQDLIRQASLIGALTISLLVIAFLTIWKLFQRSRRLEEQAHEAERLAYVGTLASGLAHEIRNPLNSLNLNMQMLEEEARETGISQSQLRLLSLTRSELGRLERLATDFLSYARPRPLERQQVPAVQMLDKVRQVLAAEAEADGVALTVQDLSDGAYIAVDPAQMSQLLLNLAKNALAAVEGIDDGCVEMLSMRRDRGVVLEVQDNGHGISDDELEKIFDLFYSTRKGGTGLGLAVVQRIAEIHDGELEIDSSPQMGTRVRLVLPGVDDPETAASPSAVDASITGH